MNATELRSDLHKLIDKINDLNLLQAIKVILTKESEDKDDWADHLSETLNEELKQSIREANKGKTISHAEAIQQIKNRYNL